MFISLLAKRFDLPTLRSFCLLFLIEQCKKSLEEQHISSTAFEQLYFYSRLLLQTSQTEAGLCLKKLEEIRHKNPPSLLPFFTCLTPYLHAARSDENVMLKLIESKSVFNRFFKERYIEDLLCSFFPDLEYLQVILCEGFSRRGFSSFFALKKPLIDEFLQECAQI